MPFATGRLHAFARRGIPAAFRFLVGSFSPMQPEQTAIGSHTRSLRPNFPAYPSTQEASVASRLFSYAASIPIRFRGSGDFSRHWQESCRPCDLRCVLPNPMSLCVLLFHNSMLLAEVAIIFRRKDSVQPGTADEP